MSIITCVPYRKAYIICILIFEYDNRFHGVGMKLIESCTWAIKPFTIMCLRHLSLQKAVYCESNKLSSPLPINQFFRRVPVT